jgi:hypothetical protein
MPYYCNLKGFIDQVKAEPYPGDATPPLPAPPLPTPTYGLREQSTALATLRQETIPFITALQSLPHEALIKFEVNLVDMSLSTTLAVLYDRKRYLSPTRLAQQQN